MNSTTMGRRGRGPAARHSATRPSRAALLAGAGALAASATAAWVAVSARRAERAHPPTGRFVEVEGVRLHCIDEGEGPPVVLLHGNNASLLDFAACGLVRKLADRHRVVAFDRPGFGHSPRPRDRLWTPARQAAAVRAALQALGVERPIVVGHSMGTLVAASLALEHPSDVQGLVLLSGYYYPTPRVDALAMLPVALPVVGDVLRYTVTALSARALLERTVRFMFAPQEVPASFLPTLSREMLLRPIVLRANAEDAAFMMPAAAQCEPRYRELRMPVTLIAGAEDRVLDVEAHSARLQREVPEAELIVVPGSGHMVHHAALATVADAIDAMSARARGLVPGAALARQASAVR